MATKKDTYIYKTIEFTQVDKETEYVFTRLEPLLSGELYTQFPNKKFIYNSYTELETDLKSIGLTSEEIQALQINQVNHYYEPLYTTKWYIAGLYDFMASTGYNMYISTHASDNPPDTYGMGMLEALMQDNLIESRQNQNLGFVFPERMQKLIYGKTINRLRMFVRAASSISVTSSDLQDYEKFHWIRVAELHSSTGRNNSIRIPGTTADDGSYIWIMFGQRSGQTYTALSSQYQTTHTHIGISVNNIFDTPSTTISDYEWVELPTNASNANNKKAYVKFGTLTNINPSSFVINFKYSNNANGTNPSDALYDSTGNLYNYIGIKITFTGYTSNDYKWYKITDMTNVIPYYVYGSSANKIYYLYIRFTTNINTANNNKNLTLYDNYFNSINYIAISFFNSTNTIDSERYTSSEYYQYIPINFGYNNYNYTASDGSLKRIWVKYADSENVGALSADNTNYGIYYDSQVNEYKIRKWLYISWEQNIGAPQSTSPGDYKLINLENIYIYQNQEVKMYTYTQQNGLQEYVDNYVWIRFADKLPVKYSNDMYRVYNVNKTKFIGISVVDSFGKLHTTSNSNGSTPNIYCWLPIIKLEEAQTTFNVDRYFYFTFAQDPGGSRTQWPKNQQLLGYAYDQMTALSKTPTTKTQEDKSAKSITLYRALKKDANTEQNLEKICSVEIPYTSMGKYAVFECDPFIINEGEYLVIGGSRDNTCPLTIKTTLPSVYSVNNHQHIDYLKNNIEFKHYDDPEVPRELIPDTSLMYYKSANYAHVGWVSVMDNFLPIDLGCGYFSSSGEITVTTKTYKEIVAQTKDADAQALKKYQEEQQQTRYQSPNYDLYVNMTYKFAKIIDGTIDYMPLYNRYKIKCKFKNEKQEVLLKRVFDTSIITPDGSVYNKPTSINLDGQIYTQNQAAYEEYFNYIENDFPETLKVTDEGIEDDNYDVAYFQCNNILKELYKSDPDDPTAQQFSDDFYNYKFLSDEGYKSYLPVVCEITISAYETATALFTKVVPVTLAAYSLVEITNDYIKTTVSKIENDYLYGLVQRTSRIEQYADRITMAVENATQGLYSKFQMTEEQILMEVVDISRNIGSQIQMAADKIQAIVYDTSNRMYSQILQEKNKISLEVASDFNKAGIYLYDDSAVIDAQTLVIRGDRTKIYGTLEIYQETAEGIVMLDDKRNDKIHITVEDIPERELLGSTSEETGKALMGTIAYIEVANTAGTIFTKNIIKEAFKGEVELTNISARRIQIPKIRICGSFIDSWENKRIELGDLIDINNLRFNLSYICQANATSYSSRNIDDTDNIYGATNGILFNWEYNNTSIDPSEVREIVVYIYNNSTTSALPSLVCDISIKDNISITIDGTPITTAGVSSNIGTIKQSYNSSDSHFILTLTSVTEGYGTIVASYNTGSTSDEIRISIRTLPRGTICWKDNNGQDITSCILYYDDMVNNQYPVLTIDGGTAIQLSDISYTGENSYIAVNRETGRMYCVDNILPNMSANYTITATYNNGANTVQAICNVNIAQKYSSTPSSDIVPPVNKTYDVPPAVKYDITTKYSDLANNKVKTTDGENVYILVENPPNNIKVMLSIDENSIKLKGESGSNPLLKLYVHPLQNSSHWEFTTGEAIASIMSAKLKSYDTNLDMYMFVNAPNNIQSRNIYNYIEISFQGLSTLKYIKEIKFIKDTADEGNNTISLYKRNDNYIENWTALENITIGGNVGGIKLENGGAVICGIGFNSTTTLEVGKYNNLPRTKMKFILFDNITVNTELVFNYIDFNNQNNLTNIRLKFMKSTRNFQFDYPALNITYATEITAGTRIGKNGMYNYIDQQSLYYFSDKQIELRLNNSGIRLTEAGSQDYSGSAGLEVYYGEQNDNLRSWGTINTWVSLFNYTPIMRFYAKVSAFDSYEFVVPAQNKEYSYEYHRWIKGEPSFSIYPKGHNFGVYPGSDDYQNMNKYVWRYNLAYHRGIISIEQLQGDGPHYFLLPLSWTYIDENAPIGEKVKSMSIPIGFSITIYNSQWFLHTDTMDIGYKKQPIIVGVYKDNTDNPSPAIQFLVKKGNKVSQTSLAFSPKYKNWWDKINAELHSTEPMIPGNFIDGHGNISAAIRLTTGNGDYQDGYFTNNSSATFIWTGYVWHCTVDNENWTESSIQN